MTPETLEKYREADRDYLRVEEDLDATSTVGEALLGAWEVIDALKGEVSKFETILGISSLEDLQ